MTVPDPGGNGSGMFALDDAIYGVSVESKDGHADGFTVWRSEDGFEWAPVDLPRNVPGKAGLGPYHHGPRAFDALGWSPPGVLELA